MSRVRHRQTIIPHGNLIAWRKLDANKLAYSGQLHLKLPYRQTKILNIPRQGYVSWLQFDFVTHWPMLVDKWDEHWLGEKDGIFITMYASQAVYLKGPTL